MKRILMISALVLLFVFAVPFIGVTQDSSDVIVASAADWPSNGKCGENVTYTFDSITGELVISGKGEISDFAMKGSVFYNNSYIKRVVISEGITRIGDFAFESCKNLTDVTIPSTVTNVGEAVFYDCKQIKRVYASDLASWLNIAFEMYFDAYRDCYDYSSNPLYDGADLYFGESLVTDLIIPMGTEEIKLATFCGCNSIKSVIIPDSVISIGEAAFYYCENLKNITLGNGVASVELFAFSSEFIENIYIKDIKVWLAVDFDAFSNPVSESTKIYLNGNLLTKLEIPEGVTEIYDSVFENYSYITELTVPSSLKTISFRAFKNCDNLVSVTIADGVEKIFSEAFYGCDNLSSLTIGNGIKTIASGAFNDCKKLKNVYASDVKSWMKTDYISSPLINGANLYFDGKLVTDLVIPDGITSVGQETFAGCKSITSVKISAGVTEIGEYAFYDCSNLKSVTLPETITKVDRCVFKKCNIDEVYYNGLYEQWSAIDFTKDNESLTNAKIHYNYNNAFIGTPQNVTTTQTTDSITLKWSAVNNATGYRVFVYNKGWKYVADSATTSYTVKNLKSAITYDFAVRAYRAKTGAVIWSPSFTRVRSVTAPQAPVATATVKSTSVTLNWEFTPYVNYRIFVKTSNGWKALKTLMDDRYVITGLTPGKSYTFALRSYVQYAQVYEGIEYKHYYVWSDRYTTVKVTAPHLDTPVARTASTATGRATVAWTDVSGETGYQIWYSTNEKSGFKKISNYSANTIKAYKTGLVSGCTYYFKVRAYKAVDGGYVYSAWSNVSLKIK